MVGASPEANRPGGQLVKVLTKYGYPGGIYPVNPKYDDVGGVRCYRSVQELDGPCDLAVIALRATAAADAVRDCAAAGVPFAVVYGGGFREIGNEGLLREEALVEAARKGGVRLIGPNCLGIVNVPDRVYAAFGPMMREPRIAPGPVSLVSQSGGFGYSLALRCAAAGTGFRYLATSGNEADITTTELIDYFLDDPGTKIVISYVEGIADGRDLMDLGRKAATLGKPILLWKAGRQEQGMRAAASHTASMTGRYEIYRAALEQAGIIEVRSIEEVADLVQVLGSGRLPQGPRIGLTGGSGGAAIVFADTCDDEGLKIPELSSATVDALREFVPGVNARGNPVDYVGGWLDDANADKFANVVRLLLADDRVDQLCIMFSTAQGKPALNGARILADAAEKTTKPILVFSSAPRHTMGEVLKVLGDAKIPVLPSPIRVAHAAARTAVFHANRLRVSAGAPLPHDRTQPWRGGEARKVLNELQTKELLATYKIPVTRDQLVRTGQLVAVNPVAYPVAVKVLSKDLPHKSDVGGVKLNIRSEDQLIAAMRMIRQNVGRASASADIEGFIVSEMVADALEAIVGVVNDEVFGPTVLLGVGGTFTEVLNDVTYRIAPFDVATARTMIDGLRGSALFGGVRGQVPRDIDALAQAVSRISEMAWELRGSLVELDINPLFVREVGAGVVVGDALAVMRA